MEFRRSAVGGGANVNVGRYPHLFAIAFGNLLRELLHIFCFNQINGAAAEASAGHAAAIISGQAIRGFDHQIEFAAAYLVVVPKTAVRFAHEFANFVQFSSAKRFGGPEDAVIFGDYMPRPLMKERRHHLAEGRQLFDRNIAERTDVRKSFCD